MVEPTRRRWLAAALACTAGAGAGVLWWARRPEPDPRPEAVAGEGLNPVRRPGADDFLGVVDASHPFTIVARPYAHELAPGRATRMLVYEIEQAGRTFLNPILRIRRGQVIHAKFWNRLDETSIVHWHGMHVDANNDGNPHYAVGPGEIYEYRIPVVNRSATCWYHPHPHGRTAHQVYQGLASFLLVEDDEELALQQALGLTLGANDLPLLLQDRRFDAADQFVVGTSAAGDFYGQLGCEIMVNYTRGAQLALPAGLARLRLLNGSSARVFRLALTAGETALPFAVIGADGGLLAQPVAAREAFLAPGERLDVLVDFAGQGHAGPIMLRSLAFDPMQGALPGSGEGASPPAGHPHAPAPTRTPAHPSDKVLSIPYCGSATSGTPRSLANGAAVDLLPIRVSDDRGTPRTTRGPVIDGRRLSVVPDLDPSDAPVRVFTLDHRGLQWQINGLAYDMRATPVIVRLGAVEIWEIRNPAHGMPHPMHMHGFHFRLLERRNSPEHVRRLAAHPRGLSAAELGWKDTALVWPGESVRFAIRFAHDHPGEQVYMFHCHNLEHEDQGMMLNVRIVPDRSAKG